MQGEGDAKRTRAKKRLRNNAERIEVEREIETEHLSSQGAIETPSPSIAKALLSSLLACSFVFAEGIGRIIKSSMESFLGFKLEEQESSYTLVPWLNWDEWLFIKDSLFSNSTDSIISAFKRVRQTDFADNL